MSNQDKPHKLPLLFARRAEFHQVSMVTDADIKNLGVDLHPLARMFTILDEDRIKELQQELQPLLERKETAGWPSWLFVGDQLLDDPRRWRACQELGLDPRKCFPSEQIAKRDVLRLYLQRVVAHKGRGSCRAASVLMIILNYAQDLPDLRTMLQPLSSKKPRPNITTLLSRYTGVGARSISNAIFTAHGSKAQFLEVYNEERNSFHEARMGETSDTPSSFQKLAKFQHRVLELEQSTNRRRNKHALNLALFMPHFTAEDYIKLKSDRSKAICEDLYKSLEHYLNNFPEPEFLSLLLPPRIMTLGRFVPTLEPWFEKHGLVTRATACVRFKAGLETNQVKPGWGYVWILARSPKQHLYATFQDALFPPATIADNRQWDYFFSHLLKSFCPPKGHVFFDTLSDRLDLLAALVRVVDSLDCTLIVPNHTRSAVMDIWKKSR